MFSNDSFSTPFVGPAMVSPLLGSVKYSAKRPRAANASVCEGPVNPVCLQNLYNIPSVLANHPKNQLGVSGFQNQSANFADLKVFSLTRFSSFSI